MGVKLDPATLVKKQGGSVSLGNLIKKCSVWRVGHGWDDSAVHGEVDSDLWMVGLRGGDAQELVRYDENDAKKVVISPSGGLTYLGDARSGAEVKRGDDEKGLVDFAKLRAAGIDKVLVLAGIYKPGGLTYDQIDNAYVRVFPLDVLVEDPSDKEEPEKISDMSKVSAIALTQVGKGARVVIFGWFEFTGPSDSDWTFVESPSYAPDIPAALAPFGVA